MVLAVCMGALALAVLSVWEPFPKKEKLKEGEGRPALMIGRVQGYPSTAKGGDTFLLKTQWVRLSNGEMAKDRFLVRVFRQRPVSSCVWGDKVSVWGILGKPGSRSGFRVSAALFVPEGKSFLLERRSAAHPLRWATSVRARLQRAFERHLSPLHARLLGGVVLGDRPSGLASLSDDFRRSGLYHLLVASGSNVGFAVGVWWVLSRWGMWWPRRAALAGVPFVAFLYAAMAGGDAPVLRAALMASFLSAGALLRRWDRPEQSLFFSAGVLLLLDPTRLFQAGFQMSYVATLAIVLVWGGRSRAEDGETRPTAFGRTLWYRGFGWIRDVLTTSVAAQVALAPLLLYYFGKFSWVGIGANMGAVPLSGLCLWLGSVLAFLDGTWPWAARVWAVPTRWCAQSLIEWAHLWAKIPGGQLTFPLNGAQAVAMFVGTLAGFVALKKKKTPLLVFIGGGTLGAVWGVSSPRPNEKNEIVWHGGRSPFVQIHAGVTTTVLENGRFFSVYPPPRSGRRSQNKTEWEYFSPEGGTGYAVLLSFETGRVLLNFGMTPRQQSDPSLRAVGRVDGVSWWSASGGPATDDLLAVLGPRWFVPLSRPSGSVRRCGAKVMVPTGELIWQADERGAGFVAPKN